jgi:hypothetical protein
VSNAQDPTTPKIAANPRILPPHVFYGKMNTPQIIRAAMYTGIY